ncbi:MAG: threonine/serine exporter family protein [Eubacteriales bacterium]
MSKSDQPSDPYVLSTKDAASATGRPPEPDVKLLFNVTLLAGEILLSSGAEIYRVEDTIDRLLGLSGFEGAESFVTPSCILMTLRDPSAETLTTLRRISVRANNLARVAQVNTLARVLCAGDIPLEDAYKRLASIKGSKGFPQWAMVLILLVLPACFYLFFGGVSLMAGIICLVTGAWLSAARFWMDKKSVVRFFSDMICAEGVAFLASILGVLLSVSSSANLVIISSIMPLVPGVAITTAIRDVLHGDYQSGTARVAEAFIIATAVAVGVGAGLFVFRLFPL